MTAKGYLTSDLLKNLKDITLANIVFIEKKCAHLGENQFTWRESKDTWSIQEVLAHVNSYSNYYNPLFSYKIDKTKFKPGKKYFASSHLGKSAWGSMKLGKANNLKRKFRAVKQYNPSLSPELVTEDSLEQFIIYQNEMLTILDKAAEVNMKKVKIPNSISKLIRLRLGDALMFAVYHAERHVQQIKNILNHKNFPKKA